MGETTAAAVSAASEASRPRALAPTRTLRQLLSLSVRSVPLNALPLPSLWLELREPPRYAELHVRAADGGRVSVRLRAAAARAPLYISPVAHSTLNPLWHIEGAALPPHARCLRSVAISLVQLAGNGSTCEVWRTDLELDELVHVVERNSGGSIGMVGFDGLVGGLVMLPPFSLVIELDVGGGARRTFTTREALAPMAMAGFLIPLSPAVVPPTESRMHQGEEEWAASVKRMEQWVETEVLPLLKAVEAAETERNFADARLSVALASRKQAERRRLELAEEEAAVDALRRELEREREEVARARKRVDEARQSAHCHAVSLARFADAVAETRRQATEVAEQVMHEAKAATVKRQSLRRRQAVALRAVVLSLCRLLPASAASRVGGKHATMCGLRVGASGREEETNGALGLTAMCIKELAALMNARLGVVWHIRGSRSSVREEDEGRAKPLPLHGKGAESGPGARLMLTATRRLIANIRENTALKVAVTSDEDLTPGAQAIALLAGAYSSFSEPTQGEQTPPNSAPRPSEALVAPSYPSPSLWHGQRHNRVIEQGVGQLAYSKGKDDLSPSLPTSPLLVPLPVPPPPQLPPPPPSAPPTTEALPSASLQVQSTRDHCDQIIAPRSRGLMSADSRILNNSLVPQTLGSVASQTPAPLIYMPD